MRTLNANDITLVRDEVSKELAAPIERHTPREGQALGCEFLPELVSQVVLPILVSLSSQVLYDVLKGKVLGSLRKKQTDKLIREMIGAELHVSGQIDETCMAELKRELLPLGFTEGQIQDLYEKIRRKLQHDVEPSQPVTAQINYDNERPNSSPN